MATAQEQANLKVVLDGFIGAIFNDRQYDRKDEFLHKDFVKHHHDGKPDSSLDQLIEEFTGLSKQFPDIKGVIKKSIASGDHVWLWSKIEGLPEGFDLDIVEICRLEGGKVIEKWDVHQQTIAGGQQ